MTTPTVGRVHLMKHIKIKNLKSCPIALKAVSIDGEKDGQSADSHVEKQQ